jgi:hypothetical protein
MFGISMVFPISYSTSGSSMHWNSNSFSQSMVPIDSRDLLTFNPMALNAFAHSGVLKQSWTYDESVAVLSLSRDLHISDSFLGSQDFAYSPKFRGTSVALISYPYSAISEPLPSNFPESQMFHRSSGSTPSSDAQSALITFSGFVSKSHHFSLSDRDDISVDLSQSMPNLVSFTFLTSGDHGSSQSNVAGLPSTFVFSASNRDTSSNYAQETSPFSISHCHIINLSPRIETLERLSDSSQLSPSECRANISRSFTHSCAGQTSHTFTESIIHAVTIHPRISGKWVVSSPFPASNGLLQIFPAANETSGGNAWIWGLPASFLLLLASGCPIVFFLWRRRRDSAREISSETEMSLETDQLFFDDDCNYTHEYENPISDSEPSEYSDLSDRASASSNLNELYSDVSSIGSGTIDDSLSVDASSLSGGVYSDFDDSGLTDLEASYPHPIDHE